MRRRAVTLVRHGRPGRAAAGMVLAALALALALVPTVSARPDLELTVQIAPGTVSAGHDALAIISLANTGPSALPDVAVTLQFPSQFTRARAAACIPRAGSGVALDCRLGTVASGATRKTFVVALVSDHLKGERSVRVGFGLRVGPGNPQPIYTSASTVILGSGSASSATQGACNVKPRTLSATLDAQTTELPSPPRAALSLGLPCTPLSVGVAPAPHGYRTRLASVTLPRLTRPAVVVLRFPDETLPDERLISNLPPHTVPNVDNNRDPLWVINPLDAHHRTIVPACPEGRLPLGWQSCILGVRQSDVDGDADTGTITLLVRGAGFGDPRYVG